MLLGLQARLGIQLRGEHAVQAWLSEYAGAILRRVKVGSDGKTGFERLGRRSRRALPGFGEKVLYHPDRPRSERETQRAGTMVSSLV